MRPDSVMLMNLLVFSSVLGLTAAGLFDKTLSQGIGLFKHGSQHLHIPIHPPIPEPPSDDDVTTKPSVTKPDVTKPTLPDLTTPTPPSVTKPPHTKPTLPTSSSLPTHTKPVTKPPLTKPTPPTSSTLPTHTKPVTKSPLIKPTPPTSSTLPTHTKPVTKPPLTKPTLPTSSTLPTHTKPVTKPPLTKPTPPTSSTLPTHTKPTHSTIPDMTTPTPPSDDTTNPTTPTEPEPTTPNPNEVPTTMSPPAPEYCSSVKQSLHLYKSVKKSIDDEKDLDVKKQYFYFFTLFSVAVQYMEHSGADYNKASLKAAKYAEAMLSLANDAYSDSELAMFPEIMACVGPAYIFIEKTCTACSIVHSTKICDKEVAKIIKKNPELKRQAELILEIGEYAKYFKEKKVLSSMSNKKLRHSSNVWVDILKQCKTIIK